MGKYIFEMGAGFLAAENKQINLLVACGEK